MIVQGTEKIRGVLSINDPKMEIKKDQPYRLSSVDFNKHDIQTAIRMGFLRVSDDSADAVDVLFGGNPHKQIVCRNEHSRPLVLDGLNRHDTGLTDKRGIMKTVVREIQPGQEFTVTEEEFNTPQMRAAISKGYIKIVKAQGRQFDNSGSEVSVSLASLLKAQPTAQQNQSATPKLETNDEITAPATPRLKEAVIFAPKAEDIKIPRQEIKPNQARHVDMNASLIDTPNPAPVQAEDVKRNAVIWNPTNGPVMNTMSSATVADPNRDIVFVDQKQEEERLSSHPVLKNKPAPQYGDLGFVDQLQEQQRVQSHPILGKRASETEAEVMFVDQIHEQQRIQSHPVLKNTVPLQDAPAESVTGP